MLIEICSSIKFLSRVVKAELSIDEHTSSNSSAALTLSPQHSRVVVLSFYLFYLFLPLILYFMVNPSDLEIN